jgi:hypothetical protein
MQNSDDENVSFVFVREFPHRYLNRPAQKLSTFRGKKLKPIRKKNKKMAEKLKMSPTKKAGEGSVATSFEIAVAVRSILDKKNAFVEIILRRTDRKCEHIRRFLDHGTLIVANQLGNKIKK